MDVLLLILILLVLIMLLEGIDGYQLLLFNVKFDIALSFSSVLKLAQRQNVSKQQQQKYNQNISGI